MQRGTLQTPSLIFLLATGSGEIRGDRKPLCLDLVIIYRDHHQESREIKRGRVQPCAREIVTEEETFFYRSCIGQRFARLELYIMMTKVVQRFKLEYDGEPVGSITRWVGGLGLILKTIFFDHQAGQHSGQTCQPQVHTKRVMLVSKS